MGGVLSALVHGDFGLARGLWAAAVSRRLDWRAYTALQNLLPARYFIPPVAKIGATCCRLLSSLCCGGWVRNARAMYIGALWVLGQLGQLVAVYLVLYVAGFGCATLEQCTLLPSFYLLSKGRVVVRLEQNHITWYFFCLFYLLSKGRVVAVCD